MIDWWVDENLYFLHWIRIRPVISDENLNKS